jgi:hypothetical protein
VTKFGDADGDGKTSFKELLVALEQLATKDDADDAFVQDRDFDVHNEVMESLEELAERSDLLTCKNYPTSIDACPPLCRVASRFADHSANLKRLSREEWEPVKLWSGIVRPPEGPTRTFETSYAQLCHASFVSATFLQGDERVSVWVRGQRLCRQRAAREERLRARLGHASALLALLGQGSIRPSAATMEMAAAEDWGLLTLPTRHLHSRIDLALGAARRAMEANAREAMLHDRTQTKTLCVAQSSTLEFINETYPTDTNPCYQSSSENER